MYWSIVNNGLSGVGGGDEAQSSPFPRCPIPLMAISSHPRDDGDRGAGKHEELCDRGEPATGPTEAVRIFQGRVLPQALRSCDGASVAPTLTLSRS